MLTAIGPWRLRSRSAHCNPELAKRIGEKLGEEDWRGGLARRIGEEDWREGWRRELVRRLAKSIGEEREEKKEEEQL